MATSSRLRQPTSVMSPTFGSIRELPLNVQAQIQASSQIGCMNDVVDGLVRNALDAMASQIVIRVDFAKGYCSVEDNGVGIPAAEF